MQYCISNLNGDYFALNRILGSIEFSKDDVLYILGDIVGGAAGSMMMLLNLSLRENVYPLWGDKDLMAYRYLKILGPQCDKSMLASAGGDKDELEAWLKEDGMNILREFEELTEEKREFVLDYMSEFDTSIFTEVENHGFLLTHAGFRNFDPEKDPSEYSPEETALGELDYNRVYIPRVYVISAGLRTEEISPEAAGKVYKNKKGHINIHSRTFSGEGKVACLCLDTGKVIYR